MPSTGTRELRVGGCPGCGMPMSGSRCESCGLAVGSGSPTIQEVQSSPRVRYEQDESPVDRVLRDRGLIDRFEIGHELGRGAFGAVFAARERVLDRQVALKILIDASASD